MSRMNEVQERIWDYLGHHALGKTNAVSVHKIRRDLNLDDKDGTCYGIRMLIRGMITECGCCIGSGAKGFWIVKDQQELEDVVSELTDRAAGIHKRARSLLTNWEVFHE